MMPPDRPFQNFGAFKIRRTTFLNGIKISWYLDFEALILLFNRGWFPTQDDEELRTIATVWKRFFHSFFLPGQTFPRFLQEMRIYEFDPNVWRFGGIPGSRSWSSFPCPRKKLLVSHLSCSSSALPRRCYTENCFSSRCLTSVIVRELVFQSWYQPLTIFVFLNLFKTD